MLSDKQAEIESHNIIGECTQWEYRECKICGRKPHSLYRMYDTYGILYYIGITMRQSHRMHEHQRAKWWWHLITDIKVEHFPDRETALKAEELAIRSEKPEYNVVHNE